MPEQEKIVLPPKYYLDYFSYLLDFIQITSQHCLGESDQTFIKNFESLSEDAKCILIRMLNRKGELFRLDKLNYEEIKNIPASVEELVEAELVSLDPPEDPLVFNLFTKAELDRIFPDWGIKQKKKEEILEELAEYTSITDFKHLNSTYTIIHVVCQDQIEFLKLLFFGHYRGMMTEFVIRDIGNVKLENLDHHEFSPWFSSREESLAVFELSKWDRLVKKAMLVLLPEEILDLVSAVNWSQYLNHPKSRKTGDKFMLRLGEYFEKNGFPEEALAYYSLARKHPARERRIRIHEKLGEATYAREIAEVAFESPFNASEKIFAKDYLSKNGSRNYRSTTTRIKSSLEVALEKRKGIRVENQALDHFYEQGYQGIHSENYLWRGLFGLLFWDELYDHSQSVFHHPLQRMPSDLYNEQFYQNRKIHLQTKIASFRSKKNLIAHLEWVYHEKVNINNPLVGWHESLLPSLKACVSHLPLKAVNAVLLEIAKNVKDNSTGFPDLFIWNDSSYYFYEIKSPNDHLSAQQLFWLDFFNEQRIKAEILRISFV